MTDEKKRKGSSRRAHKSNTDNNTGASPSGHQQQKLQGSARVIKDHCADWHNHIEKWNGMNDAGFDIINKIINLKLQYKSDRESKLDVQTRTKSEVEFLSELNDGMPEGLETLCEQLTAIHTSMTTLMSKMASITKHFQGVEKLEQKKKSDQDASPLFTSWSVGKFVQASQHLQEMYQKELEVKKVIVEDVAHHDNRDIMMMYASSWLHQPYIEDDAIVTLESMLIETGFR
ncbi:cyclin-dependent kinase 2-interacting protein-like [Lytechinus pictus]|uniref:cyclin-dependent kinase 2-interacting protein-like n=1 Tax=Lytechinus pictus TaxID=7653 RepID=UPI0030B9E4C6